MKDFTFWHGALYNAKNAFILKSIGEELAQFQKQSGILSEGYSLRRAEVAILHKMYSEKMKKFEREAMPPKPPGKPKFNK